VQDLGVNKGCCVIMAGGRGTRFWPMSRKANPKHLLPLGKNASLLKETFDRVVPLVGKDNIIIITNADQRTSIIDQLPELPTENIIGEPVGLNTAACSVLGAGIASKITGGGPFALLPADHYIPDSEKFSSQLNAAFQTASTTKTVITFGIEPTFPATGYGYIKAGLDHEQTVGKGFIEKPDLNNASKMLKKGNYYWNSGMFIWNSEWFACEANRCMPDIFNAIAPAVESWGGDKFESELERVYQNCPSAPIDTALMEKLETFTVYKAQFRWSDLGSWDAWGELAPELSNQNKGLVEELITVNSKGSIIHAQGKTVALVGVDNLVIVDTGDALLVCDKENTQSLRDVIKELENRGLKNLL
jgi:mannose-1-phosphate guanylyltransferase